VHPLELGMSRLDYRQESWHARVARKQIDLLHALAVSASPKPARLRRLSEASQSVRFMGPRHRGSLVSARNSKPTSVRIWAKGLATPFLWFLVVDQRQRIGWSPYFWK